MNKYEEVLLDITVLPYQFKILKELVERATPKKVIYENNDSGIGECPNCRERIFTPDFCPNCGQALDWSE
jgi:hypothetical protein